MNTPKVTISDGSGLDSNKQGVIIPWTDPRTEALRSEYPFVGGRTPQSMSWVAILLNDGTVTTVPKNRTIAPRKHYIAGSGSHGCLYDNCEVYQSHKDAVNSLADTFELGRTRKTKLRKESYLELGPNDGADYCEITECDTACVFCAG